MATSKQTKVVKLLNFFNDNLVKIISASVSYNRSGRCILSRTFQTADGLQHTMTIPLDADLAYKAIEQTYRETSGDDFLKLTV
jgi:hypothetical protein